MYLEWHLYLLVLLGTWDRRNSISPCTRPESLVTLKWLRSHLRGQAIEVEVTPCVSVVTVFSFADVMRERETSFRLLPSPPLLPSCPTTGRKTATVGILCRGSVRFAPFVVIHVWRTLTSEGLSSSWAFHRCTRLRVASWAGSISSPAITENKPKFGAGIGSERNIRTGASLSTQVARMSGFLSCLLGIYGLKGYVIHGKWRRYDDTPWLAFSFLSLTVYTVTLLSRVTGCLWRLSALQSEVEPVSRKWSSRPSDGVF